MTRSSDVALAFVRGRRQGDGGGGGDGDHRPPLCERDFDFWSCTVLGGCP